MKSAWGIIIVLFVAGLAMTIAGGISNRDCWNKYSGRMNGDVKDEGLWKNVHQDGSTIHGTVYRKDCAHKYQDQCGFITKMAVFSWGLFLLVVAAPGVMCYFCCCSRRPYEPFHGCTGAIPMNHMATAAPVKPPPAAYPYPGQPYPAYGQTAAPITHQV